MRSEKRTSYFSSAHLPQQFTNCQTVHWKMSGPFASAFATAFGSAVAGALITVGVSSVKDWQHESRITAYISAMNDAASAQASDPKAGEKWSHDTFVLQQVVRQRRRELGLPEDM